MFVPGLLCNCETRLLAASVKYPMDTHKSRALSLMAGFLGNSALPLPAQP